MGLGLSIPLKKTLTIAVNVLLASLLIIGILPLKPAEAAGMSAGFSGIKGLSLPGWFDGTGTSFDITDSEYLNISINVSSPVHISIKSVPEMITLGIESASEATSADIVISGFVPLTTYHMYQGTYHEHTPFTTDENGVYTYTQDLSEKKLVFIQPIPSTVFLDEVTGWSKPVGTWDPATRTAVLTEDVFESVQIDCSSVTIDGAGHTLQGSNTGMGIFVNAQSNVTIKNVNVGQYQSGIFFNECLYSTVISSSFADNQLGLSYINTNYTTTNANTFSGSTCGVYYENTAFNDAAGNTFTMNQFGVASITTSVSTMTGNMFNANVSGIGLIGSTGTTVQGNMFNQAESGVSAEMCFDTAITGNNFNQCVASAGLQDCAQTTVTGNSFSYGDTGFLTGSHQAQLVVSGNTFTQFTVGIDIHGQTSDSIVIVEENTLTGNEAGMYLASIETMVETAKIQRNKLTGNTAGIYLEGVAGTEIMGNEFTGNTLAMQVIGSSYNRITGNDFIDSAMTPQIGIDPGSVDNVFSDDYPQGGNYWSDYTGADQFTGVNQDQPGPDGFGDTPYLIGGFEDSYPRMSSLLTVSADFSWTPQEPMAGDTVVFDASASGGDIASYHWNFGDGTTTQQTTPSVSHAYTAGGDYTVILVVVSSDNQQSSVSKTVTVGETLLDAVFEWSPQEPLSGQEVTFDASGSVGDIATYYWDFGDGTIATEMDPIALHTYTAAGDYTVSLAVVDDGTAYDTADAQVSVGEAPQGNVHFVFKDQYGNLNGTGNERVKVDYYGWVADGEWLTVEPGSTLRYRAYYQESSGLYGPKISCTIDGITEIVVMYQTISMDFEDQYGDLAGTGDETVKIDYVGYLSDGDAVSVPLGSTVRNRAYYAEGTGLYGPKISTAVDGSMEALTVEYRTLVMDFEDQYGDLTGTGNERVKIDYVGYLGDGEMVSVPLGSTVRNRAYYAEGTGLYGPKISTAVEGSMEALTVEYRTLVMDFEDQYGDLTGTGNERVKIDYVGYLGDGEMVSVPLGSMVRNRAYYAEGTGLYGPKVSTAVEGSMEALTVEYRTLVMDFEDQYGDLTGTGNERVKIDYVGYLGDGEMVSVPLGSTVHNRAYYAEGTGLYGPKISTAVEGSTEAITVEYRTLIMDFEDQYGDLAGTGNERVKIDYVGYLGDGDAVSVPLGSTVHNRAYYAEGTGLYGPKVSTAVEGSTEALTVEYRTLIMDFEDQYGDLAGTGNERVKIDYVGYLGDGETVSVPLDSTVRSRAYYAEGTGLYGPKVSTAVDGSTQAITVMYVQVSFSVLDSVTSNPVENGTVKVDYAGTVENGDIIIVPMDSTVRHRAYVGNTYSAKTGTIADGTWLRCIYLWTGTEFSQVSFE